MVKIADGKDVPQKPPKYEYRKTAHGLWREYVHDNGAKFREFRSHAELNGRPLLCIANGLHPETRQMAVADGIMAVGQRARGWFAVGQFVNGNIAIGQFATGRVIAIGQFAVAPVAVGQFALGVVAAGQVGISGTGIFQSAITLWGGLGPYIVDLSRFLFG